MAAFQSLPQPLMTSEAGSFARFTIVERMPQIVGQVIEDNAYPPDILSALGALINEIAHQPIQPLYESAPDIDFWNTARSDHAGKSWLELPWYFAETYFYRKLLEAIRYFQYGPWQASDPFHKQKRKLIEADIRQLVPVWEKLFSQDTQAVFEGLLHSCLWGNRADLSHYADHTKARGDLDPSEHRHLILINHTAQVHALLAGGVQRVDFINDNVGRELLFDLAMSDFLLEQGWARQVHLNVKNQPFFVSDAMPVDVDESIALLKAAPSPPLQALGARLADDILAQRIYVHTDPFWTTCLTFRQMPLHLREHIGQADLALLKGDVNYRRLLDDAHWPFTTRMEAVTGYFPASFVALRTLKGEILVGLQPGQAEAIAAEDPTWLINGKRGVIQLNQRAV
jgi:hypothetical protein